MYGSRDTLDKRIYRRRRHRFNSRTVPNLEEPQQVVVLAVGSPHMFSGACSSSSIGCSRKTPRLVRASHRTSSSARCTSVPGRSSLTATSCRMHASSRFRVLSSRRPGVHIRREIVSACSPPSGSCLATACGSAVSVPPGSAMQPLGRAYTYQAVGTVGILRYMLSSLRLQRLCYDPVVTFI